jgi:hypothetical protein
VRAAPKQKVDLTAKPLSPVRSEPMIVVDFPFRNTSDDMFNAPVAGPMKQKCADRNGGKSS